MQLTALQLYLTYSQFRYTIALLSNKLNSKILLLPLNAFLNQFPHRHKMYRKYLKRKAIKIYARKSCHKVSFIRCACQQAHKAVDVDGVEFDLFHTDFFCALFSILCLLFFSSQEMFFCYLLRSCLFFLFHTLFFLSFASDVRHMWNLPTYV